MARAYIDAMTDKNDTDKTTSGTPRDKTIRKAGVAVGIGSAAIAAALLYANRRKKGRDGSQG